MTDPDNFYNRNDAWKIATEIYNQGSAPQPIEPYYVTALLAAPAPGCGPAPVVAVEAEDSRRDHQVAVDLVPFGDGVARVERIFLAQVARRAHAGHEVLHEDPARARDAVEVGL